MFLKICRHHLSFDGRKYQSTGSAEKARLILDQYPIVPSEPLLKQLERMRIEQRIKHHKYLLVSKCLKNEALVCLKKNTILV